MKKKRKQHEQFLYSSLLCSLISSMAVLLCVPAEISKSEMYVNFIPIVFWIGTILEQLFMWNANITYKRLVRIDDTPKDNDRIGIISIGKTRLGKIADLAFVISIIVFLILYIGRWGKENIQFILLFFIIFSFRVHCITNGKNYRYKENLLHKRG